MKFILGRKLNMSQIYDASGAAIPVTLVVARGNIVVLLATVGDTKSMLRVN